MVHPFAHHGAFTTALHAQLAIQKSVQLVLTTVQLLGAPLACVVLALGAIDVSPHDQPMHAQHDASAELGVCLAVFVLALSTTRAFSHVYEHAVSTLALCALHDVQEHKGRFVSASVLEAFELHDVVHGKGKQPDVLPLVLNSLVTVVPSSSSAVLQRAASVRAETAFRV
jgi:hypothetical protein